MNSRSRRNRRGDPVAVSQIVASTVTWDELAQEEQQALKRMNRGPYPALTEAMGRRLIDLGLAVSRANGVGISRSGRELVINTLIEARHEDRE